MFGFSAGLNPASCEASKFCSVPHWPTAFFITKRASSAAGANESVAEATDEDEANTALDAGTVALDFGAAAALDAGTVTLDAGTVALDFGAAALDTELVTADDDSRTVTDETPPPEICEPDATGDDSSLHANNANDSATQATINLFIHSSS
jgi:hypothetical protein